MKYPEESDISDYFAKLPPDVSAELAPLAEKAQRDYRRARLLEPVLESSRIQVLSQHAADVFKTRIARHLKRPGAKPDALLQHIGLDGGEAEMAFWYAHRLYQVVEGGRMLFTWHKKIRMALEDRIDEARDLSYNPDLVPHGWEGFLAESAGPTAGAADRKPPSEFFDRYQAKYPALSLTQIALDIGIARDCLFRIKGETAWVRDIAYECAAQKLGCRPEDLHPRALVRAPRVGRSRLK